MFGIWLYRVFRGSILRILYSEVKELQTLTPCYVRKCVKTWRPLLSDTLQTLFKFAFKVTSPTPNGRVIRVHPETKQNVLTKKYLSYVKLKWV